MSIRWLPRELGMVIGCDGTEKWCAVELRLATIMAKNNRAWAKKSLGWGRGLRKGHKRKDLCPDCLKLETELHGKQKADWEAEKKRRDELKKAKASGAPLPKRSRKKGASPAVIDSPSVDIAPAPAT